MDADGTTVGHDLSIEASGPLTSAAAFVAYLRAEGAITESPVPAAAVLSLTRAASAELERTPTAQRVPAPFELRIRPGSEGRTAGSLALVSSFGNGAARTAFVIEVLGALGVCRLVTVGTAGSLVPELTCGSVVVGQKTISDEGVTPLYNLRRAVPARGPVDQTVDVLALLNAGGIAAVGGTAVSTDAIFCETRSAVDAWREQGAHVVDMEASAVETVARVSGMQATSVFVISDHLHQHGWEPHFLNERVRARVAEVTDVLLAGFGAGFRWS